MRVNLAMGIDHQPLVIRLINQNFLKRLSHQILHQVSVLGTAFQSTSNAAINATHPCQIRSEVWKGRPLLS
ncbi:hypothetical protein C8R21_11471 [Nitrosospira multiformis]|uniref:Uncharacterized protein n=1 Tax=Nitrosospira multiformis TaxID=1231 RepID=A0A2T5IA74_9PROT|nr:hypothetical protein C8R21_11471 [Nitrosospira multiformis]